MNKKLLILLFAIGISTVSFAQISFEKDSVDIIYVDSALFEWASKNQITNNSSDPGDTLFTWTKKDTGLPSPWESAVCDQSLCFPTNQYSGDLKMAIGESFEMKHNIYPYNTRDCGSTKIIVVSKLNPSNRDSFYSEICTFNSASVKNTNTVSIRVFPNPATQNVTISTGSNEQLKVTILDILGNEVLTGETNKEIRIESLSSGLYFAKVKGSTLRFTKR